MTGGGELRQNGGKNFFEMQDHNVKLLGNVRSRLGQSVFVELTK
jgi:hypothetical protein